MRTLAVIASGQISLMMRNLIVLVLLIGVGCSKKDNSKEVSLENATDSTSEEEMVFNGPCIFEKSQRPQDTFPFNKSDKIQLVSYHTRRDSYSDRDLINNGKFSVDNIQQEMTLNSDQRDSLFSILYNFKPVPAGLDTLQADCYNPRHAIVFYDKKEAIAFFEICFECGGSKQSLGVDFGQFCPEKQCMLQKFFKANKTDFGLIDEICE
jgi:hypothetical protein